MSMKVAKSIVLLYKLNCLRGSLTLNLMSFIIHFREMF